MPAAAPRRQRTPEPRTSGNAGLIIAGVVGGVLLLCCGGVAGVGYLFYLQLMQTKARVQEALAEAQAEAARAQQAEGEQQLQPDRPPDQWKADVPGFGQVQPAKPVPPIKLPPLPARVPIHPAPIKEETTYNLPDAVQRLAVGGGGRFLVMHFPKQRKLGVFDVNEAKITWYVPVEDGAVYFAAGMSKLLVYLPSAGLMQCWDLLTHEREKIGKLAESPGKVEAFCMGSASAGPLLACWDGRGRLFDIDTFEPMPVGEEGALPGGGLTGGNYWASADGRVFGHNGNWGMPNGVACTTLEEGKAKGAYEHWNSLFVQPGPDGKLVYAGGAGVFTNRVKPTPDAVYSPPHGPGNADPLHVYLPALHGSYYMHMHLKADLHGPRKPLNPNDPELGLTVYVVGVRKPIAQLPGLGLVTQATMNALEGVGLTGSVHLVPRARLLIVIPSSRDRLLLHPLDLEKALEDSGVNYLLVTSDPPVEARPGQTLTYQINVKSKAGGVTFRLESGPSGMAVAKDGKLTWTVPADFGEKRADVIVSIRDADGQERFHTFALELRERKEP
jgi:hypothetical protein